MTKIDMTHINYFKELQASTTEEELLDERYDELTKTYILIYLSSDLAIYRYIFSDRDNYTHDSFESMTFPVHYYNQG